MFKKIILGLLFLFIFSVTFTWSRDFNQDLGRHIKLAEIILSTRSVPSTNLFSFTNQDYPFFNHHWLSEVIFYVMNALLGFPLLMFLKVLLVMAAVGIGTYTSIKKGGFFVAVFFTTIFVPLLLERSDIRPELFGYVLFSLMLMILLHYPSSKKLLIFLPISLFLWINFHISFVFGVMLAFFLIFKMLIIHKKELFKDKKIIAILITSFIALLINPHGIQGLLYPLSIFQNYGYPIVENQDLLFLHAVTFNPLITYFFLLSPLILFGALILAIKKKYIEALILLLFYFLAFKQIRHMPFFVLTTIPVLSIAYADFLSFLFKRIKKDINIIRTVGYTILLCILPLGIYFFAGNVYSRTFDIQSRFGYHLLEDGKKASDFMLENKIDGNIFNNFDIGGYLIYRLYPQYKVFIDNRPEAYPKDFIQDIYIKLQQDPELQKHIFEKYQIRTVVFAHTDQTPWAETFLIHMYKDTSWRMVYLDRAMVIFTKDKKVEDIRLSAGYFNNLIDTQSDYLYLLRLARIFSLFEQNESFQKAFDKAAELNLQSCTIQKTLYNQQLQNPLLLLRAEQLKKDKWYCF
ncbi:MAG: hypothetical protein Q7S61_02475 [bacterium]|nr:hypothetical protein [bacterium]